MFPAPSHSAPARAQSGARLLDDGLPLKEQAAEAVLVRWQYASGFKWDPRSAHAAASVAVSAASSSSEEAGAAPAPPSRAGGYVELPGFPGVWVGVREDVLGNQVDTRPKAPRPCKVRAGGRLLQRPPAWRPQL